MKHIKQHSKYLIVALASMLVVSGVLAQVTIPTGLTNAVQYLMQSIRTNNGTASGTVNVNIHTGGIYIRTGFLTDGTGWNNKALGLDSSGNVVYVNTNALSTPFFNLAGNYIPKINQTGDQLELSTMFQSTLGDIAVGHINPLAKMHIQGNFRIDTISGSLMQYTYSTGSTQVIGAVTPPDPSQLCNCDSTTNALNCPALSFTTGIQQGNGQGFCVDITASGGGLRSYWVYLENTTNINQGAFIVTGNRAGVMTLNPQATLDVNGNVMIASIPNNSSPTQVLVPGPNGEIQKAPFPATAANAWNLTGNNGTNPTTNFIGTIDNQSLTFRTNNTPIGQIGTQNNIRRGSNNVASAANTFAIGNNATAGHIGTFVRSNGPSFASTQANQFLIGPSAHVGINTNFQPNVKGLGISGAITFIGDDNTSLERGILWKQKVSGDGNLLTIAGQQGGPGPTKGGTILIQGGPEGSAGGKGGDVMIRGGSGTTPGHVVLGLGIFAQSNVGVRTATPENELHILGTTYTQGGIRRQYRILQGTTNLLDTDHIIMADGNTTINIPSCTATSNGREIKIYNLLSAFNINIVISGQGTFNLTPGNNKRVFICVGTASSRVPVE